MPAESVKDFYDRQYRLHKNRQNACLHSLHDLDKAKRRVARVIGAFGIQNCSWGANVLDVGCGLGYYTAALSGTGATVTGIDFSEAAIESAKTTFPECRFSRAAWPDDVVREPSYDLIWAVNFSLVNTFDVDFINERLVLEALERLKPNGVLVVGWNTDFSGRAVANYSHWPISMLRRMNKVCGLSVPVVPVAGAARLSWLMIRASLVLGRSIPIFMVRTKRGEDIKRERTLGVAS